MPKSHGKFVWYDLMTSDAKAAESYYHQVMGWTTTDYGMPGRHYTILSNGPTMIGGIMPIAEEPKAAGAMPGWMGYISVVDVDDYARRVVEAGGSIHREPEDIPQVGRFAVAADPHGATFLLFREVGGQAPAPVPLGTPGHIGWRELHSGDLESAWPFYSSLFGWTIAGDIDMGPMGMYRMFAPQGETSAAGALMTKMPETPAPFWLYYFNVDTLDAAMERADKGGGKLLMGPHEVPGGQWIAQYLDPQGAVFAMVAFKR